IAIILGVLLAVGIAYGFGYASGAFDTAKKIITIGIEVLDIKNVSAIDLFEQYHKLKGGII
ncbi:hypothetical protein LCGC14_2340730, partial [marine sediment metagenome]